MLSTPAPNLYPRIRQMDDYHENLSGGILSGPVEHR